MEIYVANLYWSEEVGDEENDTWDCVDCCRTMGIFTSMDEVIRAMEYVGAEKKETRSVYKGPFKPEEEIIIYIDGLGREIEISRPELNKLDY